MKVRGNASSVVISISPPQNMRISILKTKCNSEVYISQIRKSAILSARDNEIPREQVNKNHGRTSCEIRC